MSDQDHRRKADRAPLGLRAELVLPGREAAPVRLGNMGPDGAFIESDANLAPGAQVRVRFGIDSHPIPFDVEAEVRWQRKLEGFGVQFVAMAGYDRAALDDYCQRRLEVARMQRGGNGDEG